MNLAQHDHGVRRSLETSRPTIVPPVSSRPKTTYVRRRPEDRNDAQLKQVQSRRPSVVLMALIAVSILGLRRSDYESPWVLIVEGLLCALLIGTAVWLQWKGVRRYGVLVAAALAMPWAVDRVARGIGYGNGFEIVMLSSLLWGAVAGSSLARTTRTLGLSVICSGFLTLFTTFISDNLTTTWFAYAWGAVCLWWLVSNHWEKLEKNAAYDIQSGWGQRWVYLSVGCIAFAVGTAFVADRIPVLGRLTAEIMPTSGGTSAKDSAAQRGVGDGDQLVAARSRPSSFGAVDTDLFLDSEKPSLFDLFTDEFGEVKKRDRVEQTQALNPNEIQDQEGAVSEANQSPKGGEFSIERRVPKERPRTEDIASDALMFWQGAAHSHLAVERLDRFDGAVWRSSLREDSSAVRVAPTTFEIDGQAWFAPGSKNMISSISPFVGAVAESIKFTRYGSSVIPTRAGMQLWSIDDITRADFFDYGMDDSLSMPGRQQVPDYTVVRLIHSWIDMERVEDLLENCAPGRSHAYVPHECQSTIHRLAHRYAGNHFRGWGQVQSVVQGVRDNFQLQADLDESLDSTDSHSALDRFLKKGGGPSYLFATATALMLDHLGYETRLVTGFYARSRNLVGAERDIAILPSDVHVWLEIHAGHNYWIPLEPSPGFHEPAYTASLRYRLYQARWWIVCGLVAMAGAGGFAFMLRKILFDGLVFVLSPVLHLLQDRSRIKWMAWLLDTRAWLAGHPRGSGTVPKVHFHALRSLRGDWESELNRFFRASDRLCYGGATTLDREDRRALHNLWTRLTTRRMQAGFHQR